MQRLANKTALVTGGGSGIGQAVCQRLAGEGAHVLIVDLNMDTAQQTVEQIQASGGTASAHSCDIANTQAVKELFSELDEQNPIDILVNSAGIAHIGTIEQCNEDDLDRLYQVNVKGTYNCMSALVPTMKARQRGAIVNLASVASSVGIADRFAYSMTKGAVLTMTYSVAKDYIGDGIRCNCIAPGRVHTPFVDNFLANNYPDNVDEMFDKLSKTQPIGRMGKPDEMAGLVAYLCSDESAFITGCNFPIDGGFVTLNN
ncbi:SDR family oxidoreductase [Porticoccus sp. W117]|uniref:SDR family NAD(P)-dependent oxidoreductase n=1 Tax=Porticoccus sp. W117 TaxID=3054777 RepID=UPI00259197BC|nr:SDR family oxidoreductase [Porticoccus sp. W117]MDM3872122.1 SDR family oxidoreductase [Porticoccus sp. W117]